MAPSVPSSFSVDSVILGVDDTTAAAGFYSTMFPTDGAMALEFRTTDELSETVGAGARGGADTSTGSPAIRAALAVITPGPSGVTALVTAAENSGAEIIKPPKKQLFGEFAASLRAPGGTLWKLAAASRKDPKGNAGSGAQTPTETAVYLAVSSPKKSKKFYEALGMTPEHDYGDTFVDFTVSPGQSRLGLIPRGGLVKDLGVPASEAEDTGFSGVVLRHDAGSRQAVDSLVAAAESAGGRVIPAHGSGEPEGSGQTYAAVITDPDGHVLVLDAG